MKRRMAWRRSSLLCTVTLLALCPVVLAGSKDHGKDRSFDRFFAQFKAAVARKDEATLTKLMAPRFDFIRGLSVPPPVVFQGLAADGGRQWANLQDAVSRPPIVPSPQDSAPARRFLRCTPIFDTGEYRYNCLVIFEQDSQQRWRWKGMIMPIIL